MLWLGRKRGYFTDWVTQVWVRLTGRTVSLDDAPWLQGPNGSTSGIGGDFFERWAEDEDWLVSSSDQDHGLIEDFDTLAGPRFDPEAVHPLIRDFYEGTTAFDLGVQVRWSGLFRPFGWLISALFARRLNQLNIPQSDQAIGSGVESRIVRLVDRDGRDRATGWVRTPLDSKAPIFVGQYGTGAIPGCDELCVKVVFPLPNGNAIVFLRPQADAGEGMSLMSDGRSFGDPGFYFTVRAGDGSVHARYVRTMKEHLALTVDGDTILASHRFRVFGLRMLVLSYRITRAVDA